MAILPAYTVLIYENPTLGTGTSPLATVPHGYRWVFRDIELINVINSPALDLGIAQLLADDGSVMHQSPLYRTVGGVPYNWQGHQVIDQDRAFSFYADTAGWSLRITGYQLSISG